MGDLINTIKGIGRRLPLVTALYYYLLQLPGIIIKRGLMLGDERMTQEEKGMIAKNQLKWQRFAARKVGNYSGYVLVDTLVNSLPGFYYSGVIVGKYLGHERNLKPLFLLSNFYDSKIKRIIKSYSPADIIYFNRPGQDIFSRPRQLRDWRARTRRSSPRRSWCSVSRGPARAACPPDPGA